MYKRFKSLARLGHVPKYDDAKAWLYGKRFVALPVGTCDCARRRLPR